MKCTIDWNVLNVSEWQERFAKIDRSNLLQSYEYALAACPIKKQKARWGLIRLDGAEAGLVQILEAGIFKNALHAITLDCGPLWFTGFGEEEDFKDFLQAFRKKFPKRVGRKIRFIPEMPESKGVKSALEKYKFSRSESSDQQTYWIDLRLSPNDLLGKLKKNWRNMLTRAQKDGLKTYWSIEPAHLKALLQYHMLDKIEKDYRGPSVELIAKLAQATAPQGKMILGRTEKNGAVLGYALFFLHGKSATYQIGWTSTEGRKCGAQNLLLWDALSVLQERHITDLDLGGINDDTAKGVKTFKSGMGGDHVRHAGLYLG